MIRGVRLESGLASFKNGCCPKERNKKGTITFQTQFLTGSTRIPLVTKNTHKQDRRDHLHFHLHVQDIVITGKQGPHTYQSIFPGVFSLLGVLPCQCSRNAACCLKALFLSGNSKDSLRFPLSKTPMLIVKKDVCKSFLRKLQYL